jgi:hypothetical protein
MLHSGSRGVGNRIGSFFIEKAKEEMRRWHINLPDADLAYLSEGSTFYGWWRLYGTFILTSAAPEPLAPPIALEDLPALTNAIPLHSWLAHPRW